MGERRVARGEGVGQWGRAGLGCGGQLAGLADGPEAVGSEEAEEGRKTP